MGNESPHPFRGKLVGESITLEDNQDFHEELRRIGAPVDLIQQLPSPVDKIRTLELMKLADWLIVTGSQSNVRAAYSSGTPAFGVGAGNVTVIVDETADLDAAAFKIMKSKTFDHATSCSSENALVLVDKRDLGGRRKNESSSRIIRSDIQKEHEDTQVNWQLLHKSHCHPWYSLQVQGPCHYDRHPRSLCLPKQVHMA